jgi:hypothetical protein
MKTISTGSRLAAGFILIGLAANAYAGAHTGGAAPTDHAHHHQMTAEQLAELRAKIPLYREYSDDDISAGMSRMKNSWGWVAETPAGARVGILALAHGFKEQGNRQFTAAYSTAATDYPKAYAFGMAMMTSDHIQSAISALEEKGVERIVVIPTTTADNTTLVRQWDYIFGKREDSAYLDVPRVQARAELIWAPTPTAHPLMAEILLDYARELSRDPAREMVVILGHGPQDSEDNEKEIALLSRHAAFLRDQGGFSEVRAANVQDDAPTEVRAANVAMVRGWAESAMAEGRRVIVVHTALTQSGVVGRLARDVEGVADFNAKGLMEHPLFGQWIDGVVAQSLASAQ